MSQNVAGARIRSNRIALESHRCRNCNQRLRLGAPIVRPHVCVCGKMVTVDGLHGLSCRHGSGRHSRHNQVNDLLCRAFVSTGTLATREPHSLCTRDGKRPDGVTQVPWRKGRCIAWDATCPDTFAQSHVSMQQSGRFSSGGSGTEESQKYADIISVVDFAHSLSKRLESGVPVH